MVDVMCGGRRFVSARPAACAAAAARAAGHASGVTACLHAPNSLQPHPTLPCRNQEAAGPSEQELAHRHADGDYSVEQPFYAELSAARWLTGPLDRERQVLHCEFDVGGCGAPLHPGDSLGVKPLNDAAVVDGLLDWLRLDGSAVVDVVPREGEAGGKLLPHLHAPCTIRHAFQAGVGVLSLGRGLFLMGRGGGGAHV